MLQEQQYKSFDKNESFFHFVMTTENISTNMSPANTSLLNSIVQTLHCLGKLVNSKMNFIANNKKSPEDLIFCLI